jgi:3-oxoacyl-[acyl-carrier protein] reductase
MTTGAAGLQRIAVVTGAASGIGAAIVRRLAVPGTGLLVHTGRNAQGLKAVAKAAMDAGAVAHVLTGDLGEPATARRIAGDCREVFGRIDVLVSNAGYAQKTGVGVLDESALEASLNVITKGFFRLCTAALPLMTDHGRIVGTSSFLAHVYRMGGDSFPASAAAKAGLEALVKSLAAQLAPRAITVNAVVPGYIRKDPGAQAALDDTAWRRALEQIPLARLGTPDEVAAVVAFLCGSDAAYVTGQVWHVNGGLTL